ncbi:MAG TPA: hypothetical protein VEB20_25545 [Azospirillaceae bacterium]|nr:hypothetical protein [Azospirillaceae bacterium]
MTSRPDPSAAPTPFRAGSADDASSPAAAGAGRRAVLLSGHYYASHRKANFHFLADALAADGWDVTFVTTQISPVSRLRGDPRFEYPVEAEAGRPVAKPGGVTSFVWMTPFHVFHLRSDLMDRLSAPLFGLYPRLPLGALEPIVRAADLIMVESTGALLLVERLRRLNPRARLVYRVSDDTRNLGQHRIVVEAEERVLPLFDLVSAPSRYTVRRFGHLPNIRFQPHGVDVSVFDRPTPRPYPPGGVHLVSVGHSFFDYDFADAASALFPDWTFHLVGKLERRFERPNVRWYGEIPFAETVPFVQHADAGLAPYVYREGAETLADSSLKLTQYTWCRLPSVAPDFATRADRPHVLGYNPGDRDSIYAALQAARNFDRQSVSRAGIRSWAELARLIAGDAAEAPAPQLLAAGGRA